MRNGRRGSRVSEPAAQAVDRQNAPGHSLAQLLRPDFWQPHRQQHGWIDAIHTSEPIRRMELVREGVPAQAVQSLAEVLGIPRDQLTRELRLARATVERKLKTGGRLGLAASERVLGVTRLIGQVRQMVEESGNPKDFDAARWVAQWLQAPSPALGGRSPIEFMDTAEGREIVSALAARMQSGAYA